MKKLSIIGCGNVAKTLAYLWTSKNVFSIGDVLNQSQQSTSTAVSFIGAGKVVDEISAMNPADVFLICTPDEQIAESCKALVASGLLQTGTVVFHCSGALPSSILSPAKQAGAYIGSIHPLKSFANPEPSIQTFNGTFCGAEGEEQALQLLRPAFEAIGGHSFSIDPQFKTFYHTAAVIACNYLTSLLEMGSQVYIKAGLDRETSMQIMEPMVRGTIENIFACGTAQALTGPIARGDHSIVSKQLTDLTDWNPLFGNIYRDLGMVALELSHRQGTASADSLTILQNLLARE